LFEVEEKEMEEKVMANLVSSSSLQMMKGGTWVDGGLIIKKWDALPKTYLTGRMRNAANVVHMHGMYVGTVY
jgi:hypothetical protein